MVPVNSCILISATPPHCTDITLCSALKMCNCGFDVVREKKNPLSNPHGSWFCLSESLSVRSHINLALGSWYEWDQKNPCKQTTLPWSDALQRRINKTRHIIRWNVWLIVNSNIICTLNVQKYEHVRKPVVSSSLWGSYISVDFTLKGISTFFSLPDRIKSLWCWLTAGHKFVRIRASSADLYNESTYFCLV